MQDFTIKYLHKEANLHRKTSILEKRNLGWVLCTNPLSPFTLRIQNCKIVENHEGRFLGEGSKGFHRVLKNTS